MALVLGTNYGFVTAAPSADPSAGGTVTIDNNAYALKVVSSSGAVHISSIGWWCDNATEAANFQVGIYADSSGEPGALLASSGDTAKGTGAGWKSGTVSYDVQPNTTYWLAVQLDNVSTGTNMDCVPVAGNAGRRKNTETALTDPWGTTDTSDTYTAAIYAVYIKGEIKKVSGLYNTNI